MEAIYFAKIELVDRSIDGHKRTYLEKRVPQSQRYSLVPQVLECAFQSDCTA
jgi:hypothetical protein